MQPADHLRHIKTTVIVNGRMALRTERLKAAREGAMGTQIMTIEHAVARLAGGFLQIIDLATLRGLVTEIINDTDLGELNPMRGRPGMPNACASTLMKYWLSGISPDEYSGNERIRAILALEEAVMSVMPKNLMRPADLVALAVSRVEHAPMVLGEAIFRNMTDLHPVWRALFEALVGSISVTWDSGPRELPDFVKKRKDITRDVEKETTPRLLGVSCASERHEVIEAVRWVRETILSGVCPSQIAVATVSMQTYDDIVAGIVAETDAPIHMASGIPALLTRDGQATAALADVMLRGISQKRVCRLISLLGNHGALSDLPVGWEAALPPDASLTTVGRWRKALERKPSTQPIADIVIPIIDLVSKGPQKASEIGQSVLWSEALALWSRALKDGPATALDRTLKSLKVDDRTNPLTSACFMSAEDLAASPRSHVRLIGLTSRNWPRHQTEDALIPRHIVPAHILDPMPLSRVDRVDFETILSTAENVVLSWPRRDAKGRDLGISGLVPKFMRENPLHLNRSRLAEHVISETDRLFSRPSEFAARPEAVAVASTVADWNSEELTAHDGLIQPDHPRITAVLSQPQSATSLRKLLRDPLGFVWSYGLGFKAPEYEDEPLLLDPRQFGNIVHEILRRTVEHLDREGGFSKVSTKRLLSAVEDARLDVGGLVETSQPVPPALIWFQTMDMAEAFAKAALSRPMPEGVTDIRSYAEVSFGKEPKWISADRPWEQDVTVTIPGTSITVRGVIDRLDIVNGGTRAFVEDYKSGKTPSGIEKYVLNGGKELQRPIYCFAVKTLLGNEVEVDAALSYPLTGTHAVLPEPEEALKVLSGFVGTAAELLREGVTVAGIDAEDAYSETRFALPAQADALYLGRKRGHRRKALAPLPELWSHA
ncbi:PD-(D/E)XK nuclease family protein [Agrobacterium rubi]|nr:PD-(D/E)XK nuclease family protein [Agrobacterium rubi]NTF24802.1 PD-(D/E)XK nuclease family protein [Agrobacterium rubi]